MRKRPDAWSPDLRLGTSVALLAAMVLVAASSASLGLVNGISGSLGGGFLCYVAPGIISLRLAEKQEVGSSIVWNALVFAGVAIGVLGTYVVITGT